MVYQISKVCLALTYMQRKHMVYGEFHTHHCLVLDQKENINAYSTPLRHEVCNVDHKMVMQGIDLFYNILSHLCVKHKHYPEHDTVCLSIFFPLIIYFILPDQRHHICECSFVRCCWNSFARITSSFWLPLCIFIWESNLFDTLSWTLEINWCIYNSHQHNLVHLQPLYHDQVHLCLDQS